MDIKKNQSLYRISHSLLMASDGKNKLSLIGKVADKRSLCGKFTKDSKIRLENGEMISAVTY